MKPRAVMACGDTVVHQQQTTGPNYYNRQKLTTDHKLQLLTTPHLREVLTIKLLNVIKKFKRTKLDQDPRRL